VSPDDPSPESTKIPESLVLVEFIADLFPDSGILPKDLIERARVRLFIDAVSTKFLPCLGPFLGGGPFEPFFTALEALQGLLSTNSAFAVSNTFTAADIALAPFLLRLEVLLEHDIGAYRVGEGRTAYDIIFSTNGHFARLVQYLDALKARESVRSTFDVVCLTVRLVFKLHSNGFGQEVIKEGIRKRSAPLRVQAVAPAAV
jgi:glutathione S-transferase